MIDIYVLDKERQAVGVIDAYKSMIWTQRYQELGDCELYVPATDENVALLRMGYYLARSDNDMLCKINRIELTTNAEEGNYLTVTGTDAKSILDQRIIWTTSTCNGNVETFIRRLITNALISPSIAARKVNFVTLAPAAGFTATATEQVSYANLGEKIREYCKQYGWGYRATLTSAGKIQIELYAGEDRSAVVIFSDDYENLSTSDYINSCENMGNTALVGGQGEGKARILATLGTAAGEDRFEQFVDSRNTAQTINYAELVEEYPGGSIVASGSLYNYRLARLDLEIIDATHKAWLQSKYSGTIVTISGKEYYRITNAVIATLETNAPMDTTTVTLTELIYHSYLLNNGVQSLAGQGEIETFQGEIIPDVTFVYGRDYNLGDIVTVGNEYDFTTEVRISEILECMDENGYRVEPTFEYIEYI